MRSMLRIPLLAGFLAGPQAAVALSYDFGAVPFGESRTVALQSSDHLEWFFPGYTPGYFAPSPGFTINPGDCAGPYTSNAPCTMTVTFAPDLAALSGVDQPSFSGQVELGGLDVGPDQYSYYNVGEYHGANYSDPQPVEGDISSRTIVDYKRMQYNEYTGLFYGSPMLIAPDQWDYDNPLGYLEEYYGKPSLFYFVLKDPLTECLRCPYQDPAFFENGIVIPKDGLNEGGLTLRLTGRGYLSETQPPAVPLPAGLPMLAAALAALAAAARGRKGRVTG